MATILNIPFLLTLPSPCEQTQQGQIFVENPLLLRHFETDEFTPQQKPDAPTISGREVRRLRQLWRQEKAWQFRTVQEEIDFEVPVHLTTQSDEALLYDAKLKRTVEHLLPKEFAEQNYAGTLTREELQGAYILCKRVGPAATAALLSRSIVSKPFHGISMDRVLLSLVPRLATTQAGLVILIDFATTGHEITPNGFILGLLFGLIQQKRNPRLLLEHNAGRYKITLPQHSKTGHSFEKISHLSFDFYDPQTKEGHEVKFNLNSQDFSNHHSSAAARFETQLQKIVAWLREDSERTFVLSFIGPPSELLLRALKKILPDDLGSRITFKFYTLCDFENPVLTVSASKIDYEVTPRFFKDVMRPDIKLQAADQSLLIRAMRNFLSDMQSPNIKVQDFLNQASIILGWFLDHIEFIAPRSQSPQFTKLLTDLKNECDAYSANRIDSNQDDEQQPDSSKDIRCAQKTFDAIRDLNDWIFFKHGHAGHKVLVSLKVATNAFRLASTQSPSLKLFETAE